MQTLANPTQRIALHRVITMLNREELEFLDKLGKDSLFSTGHKLTYNEILKGLIDTAMEMKLSGEKVDSFVALKERILQEIQAWVKEELKNKNKGNLDT